MGALGEREISCFFCMTSSIAWWVRSWGWAIVCRLSDSIRFACACLWNFGLPAQTASTRVTLSLQRKGIEHVMWHGKTGLEVWIICDHEWRDYDKYEYTSVERNGEIWWYQKAISGSRGAMMIRHDEETPQGSRVPSAEMEVQDESAPLEDVTGVLAINDCCE